MIYTGSKAIQYLSIPLFTIFKNLTIILIAYGERVYFNGPKVTGFMLIAFFLMVLSSVIGGWSDIAEDKVVKGGDASYVTGVRMETHKYLFILTLFIYLISSFSYFS